MLKQDENKDGMKDQYCFRTQRAIDTLQFMRSYQVWK